MELLQEVNRMDLTNDDFVPILLQFIYKPDTHFR